MSTTAVQEFRKSLSAADVESTVVTPDGVEDAMLAAIERPAVGAPLPFTDLSLSGLPITVDPSPSELRDAVTGVTGSRLGISSLGAVAVESRSGGDEFVSLYPERHVAVLREQDIEPDLSSAFDWLSAEFEVGRESLIFATGPSATGDMGALVQGVHGPETVHVVVVTDDE